jgi:hypothetical protein
VIKRPDFDTFRKTRAVEAFTDLWALIDDLTSAPRIAASEIMLFIGLWMAGPLVALPLVTWVFASTPALGSSIFAHTGLMLIFGVGMMWYASERKACRLLALESEDVVEMRRKWLAQQGRRGS